MAKKAKEATVIIKQDKLSIMDIVSLLPLVLMIVIVPLIVRIKPILLSEELQPFWVTSQIVDQYSYFKSYFIIILVVYMLAILFLTFKREKLNVSKVEKYILISLLVFIGLTFLSALLSDYTEVSFWGSPERREGFVMQFAYILMTIYAIYIIRDKNYFKYIIISLGVLTSILIVIGLSQMFKHDILLLEPVQKLIFPKVYHNLIKTDKKHLDMLYLTFGNSNYVGSFVAFAIPLFATLGFSPNLKLPTRISFWVLSLLTSVILIGSKSQAGIVGLFVAVIFIGIIFAKQMFSHKKLLITLVIGIIVVVVSANILSQGKIFESVANIVEEATQLVSKTDETFDPTYGLPIYDLKIDSNIAEISTIYGLLKVNFDSSTEQITFTDENNKIINCKYENGGYFLESPFEKIGIQEASSDEGAPLAIGIGTDNKIALILELNKEDGIHLINSRYTRFEYRPAPYIGFEGNEKIGSGRGYIWSRSLPMLRDTLFLGYGPDNYFIEFPQYDIFGKTAGLNNPYITVDKPHNLYLQYGINSGVIATIALMIAWGLYIVDSIKLYIGKKKYSQGEIYGIACVGAIIGYLGAGFFNDSVVAVAPLFWVIFGCGISLNYINKNTKEE